MELGCALFFMCLVIEKANLRLRLERHKAKATGAFGLRVAHHNAVHQCAELGVEVVQRFVRGVQRQAANEQFAELLRLRVAAVLLLLGLTVAAASSAKVTAPTIGTILVLGELNLGKLHFLYLHVFSLKQLNFNKFSENSQ